MGIRLLLAAACTLLLAAGCGAATVAAPPPEVDGCPSSHTHPAPAAEAALHAATLCLLNAERRRQGLAALVEDPALGAAAAAHAQDMGRRNYFEHRSPDGVEPWMRIGAAGYRAALVGENLAWGEADRGTPARARELWLASPGHRANLLEPRYTQIGIAVAFDAPEAGRPDLPAGVYVTTFGSAPVAR